MGIKTKLPGSLVCKASGLFCCHEKSSAGFILLGVLLRYTDRKGGEAVEYGDLDLVRGIKGGDKGGVRAAGPPLVSAGLWVRDDQGDDLGIRPDSRKRVRAAEAADDGGIRRVEQLLHDAAQRDRQREPQQFARGRAVQHIQF